MSAQTVQRIKRPCFWHTGPKRRCFDGRKKAALSDRRGAGGADQRLFRRRRGLGAGAAADPVLRPGAEAGLRHLGGGDPAFVRAVRGHLSAAGRAGADAGPALSGRRRPYIIILSFLGHTLCPIYRIGVCLIYRIGGIIWINSSLYNFSLIIFDYI